MKARGCLFRDGSIAGTIAEDASKPKSGPPRKKYASRGAAQITFSLNNDANYDNGLIAAARSRFLSIRFAAARAVHFRRRARFHRARERRAYGRVRPLASSTTADRSHKPRALPDVAEIYPTLKNHSGRFEPGRRTYLGDRDARPQGRHARAFAWAVGTSPRSIGMIGQQAQGLSVYLALDKDGIAQQKFAGACLRRGPLTWRATPEEIAISITADSLPSAAAPQSLPQGP